ncbi:hypothetical protein SUDANB70_03186 [Streptomyces sp. enrichment culture]
MRPALGEDDERAGGKSYGSQLVDRCTGLPSARNSYAVRTTDDSDSYLSRLADNVESVQLGMATQVGGSG